MAKSKIDQYGNKVWFNEDNKFHRLDGPAIEYEDGSKAWFLEGVEYTEEEYNKLIGKYNSLTKEKVFSMLESKIKEIHDKCKNLRRNTFEREEYFNDKVLEKDLMSIEDLRETSHKYGYIPQESCDSPPFGGSNEYSKDLADKYYDSRVEEVKERYRKLMEIINSTYKK